MAEIKNEEKKEVKNACKKHPEIEKKGFILKKCFKCEEEEKMAKIAKETITEKKSK